MFDDGGGMMLVIVVVDSFDDRELWVASNLAEFDVYDLFPDNYFSPLFLHIVAIVMPPSQYKVRHYATMTVVCLSVRLSRAWP